MKARPFRESDWFKPGPPGARYPRRFPPMINGVYAIRNAETKQILYVGESHSKRLYDTVRRHLARWIDRGEWREAYHRDDIEIAWRASREPLIEEAALIIHYQPRDNSKGLELEEVPDPESRAELPDWAEPEAATWFEPVADEAVPF